MEAEKVYEKLKATMEEIKSAEGSIDERASNATAMKGLARSQRLLLDSMVGLLHIGTLEPEEVPEEEEPEEEPDEFDVDTLKQVYAEPKKAKPAAKAVKRKR